MKRDTLARRPVGGRLRQSIQACFRPCHLAFAILSLLTAVPAAAQHLWTNFAGVPSGFGNVDGSGSAARFHDPNGVAVDGNGNVYVADTVNHTIRKITSAGVVTTLAGNAGTRGSADGTGSAARFNEPFGVAVDGAGNVYVADTANHAIRKITGAGVVTTLAGSAGNPGSADGTGSAARFLYPFAVAVDGSGNLYVADTVNHTIRKITGAGVVTTLAGAAGNRGSADGTGTAASFGSPRGVAVDGSGNVYVADHFNHTIRRITSAGVVTTLAGTTGSSGGADGTGSAARFNYPWGVAVDGNGNIYVAESTPLTGISETNNHTIRKITGAGVVTTLAGTVGYSGSTDGIGSAARFYYPTGVAVDGSGNVYVADSANSTIRKIASTGMVTTLAGSADSDGSDDGTGREARFAYPFGVAVDGNGNLYVGDTENHTIRKITSTGVVTTLAGFPGVYGSDDGTGSEARFLFPRGVAVDGSGNVYVADSGNFTIRKITSAGVVTTLAGLAGPPGRTGTRGSADGPGSEARFYNPTGVAVDGSGNVYVADSNNYTIRKITSAGMVTTLAGTAGSSGSADGAGSAARFSYASGVAVDGSGNVYVADGNIHLQVGSGNSCTIRKITSTGVVTTLAGMAGSSGSEDGTGSAARFHDPTGVAVDGSGNVYVADSANSTIRKITSDGVVTTIGGKAGNVGGADGVGEAALFSYPCGVATTVSGLLYVADTSKHRIVKGTVIDPSTLSSISLSSGKLSPAFTSLAMSYTATVPNTTNSLTITPVAVDAAATIQLRVNNGSIDTVTSGSASGALLLNVGANTVEIKVTAPDGVTTKTYTLTITRALEKVSPTVTIKIPAKANIANPFTLSGTVKELGGLASMTVSLNGGAAVPATFTATIGAAIQWSLPGMTLENGANQIKVVVTDTSGNTSTVTKTVTLSNLRPELAGVFNALLVPVNPPSNETMGLVTVTVGTTGIFTGKVLLGGVSKAFGGTLRNDGTARFNPTLSSTFALVGGTKARPKSYGTLVFGVNGSDGLTGNLIENSTALATFTGQVAPYGSKAPVPVALLNQPLAGTTTKGVYTLVFSSKIQVPAMDKAAYPQGDGYATLSLSKTGAVAASGRLADGTTYSAKGVLRADKTVALYTVLYNKLGGFAGELAFEDEIDTDVSGADLLWLRPNQPTQKTYRDGWESGIYVDATGTKFAKPTSLDFSQGVADLINGNAHLVFSEGLLTGEVNKPVSVEPMTGAVKLIPTTDKTYSLTLKAATGLFTGSFIHSDTKKTSFGGVLLNKGANRGGFGFFLSSPTSSTPGQSGHVFLDPAGP